MEIPYHPLEKEIGKFLHKYLDKEIIIKVNLESSEITIEGNDAVGVILEEFIAKLLTEKFEHLTKGESNEPPDIFDEKYKWNLEIKCFLIGSPNQFDIYDITNFFGNKEQEDWLSKAMHKTDYLIFGYEINSEGKRYLKSIYHKKLHEILSYGGRHEISVQYSKSAKQYKKIRPARANTWNDETKTPEYFIKHFEKFIDKLPKNLTGNKSELKKRITKQFANLKQEIYKNKSS